jgi:hypothetical protein
VTNRQAYFDGRNLEQMTNMTELIEVFPRLKEKIHIKVKQKIFEKKKIF